MTLGRTGPETERDGKCEEEIDNLWAEIKKAVAKSKGKEKRRVDPDDDGGDGSQFQQLLGGFGTHTNLEARKKAERLAAMKPDDARRNRRATRTNQFNARVDDETIELAKMLIEKFSARDKRKWSQADLIIFAIGEIAKAQKGKAA
jgi:hypothetical protein